MKKLSILLLAAAFAGCASTESVTHPSSAPASIAVPIKIDDALEDFWVVKRKVAPDYPTGSVKRHQQGCVTLGYFIEPDGSTSRHWVISSSPKYLFERSALKAGRKLAYTPGILNEKRQPVMTTNHFSYRIAYGGFEPSRAIYEEIIKRCKDATAKVLEEKYDYLPSN